MAASVRPNATHFDPGRRIARLHQSSIDTAAAHRQMAAAAACRNQAIGCRQLVNALESEVTRLRQGVDRVDLSRPLETFRSRVLPDVASDVLRAPNTIGRFPTERKSYAVDSLGSVPPTPSRAEPPAPRVQEFTAYSRVTNLGSLMDLLV